MRKRIMQHHIFRKYDIRGKVGSEMPLGEVYYLGLAIAEYLLQRKPDIDTVIIGMDGRTHSPHIRDSIVRAFCDSGIDVTLLGVCPTPVVSFMVYTGTGDAGLMITASHNGPEYNGIKMLLGKESIWGEQLQEIRVLYERRACAGLRIRDGVYHKAVVTERLDANAVYVAWLAEHFAHLKDLNIKIVMDCANGTAGTVLPLLVDAMGWQNQVTLLYPEIDGSYPHHIADPVVDAHMDDLRDAVRACDADLGIGFDGDCDRMAPITHVGELVAGDSLIALFSQALLAEYPHAAIVYDSKCSRILPEYIRAQSGIPHISASGHSLIKAAMVQKNALFAGELSCHFFFNDRYFGYDDGIYAALRLIELLKCSQKCLGTLVHALPQTFVTPEIRIPCKESEKYLLVERLHDLFEMNPEMSLECIDGFRVTLPHGWGVVRASNTQPELSMRFEARSSEDLKVVKKHFYTYLEPFFDAAVLDQYLK